MLCKPTGEAARVPDEGREEVDECILLLDAHPGKSKVKTLQHKTTIFMLGAAGDMSSIPL
jgi:hypothetical protein